MSNQTSQTTTTTTTSPQPYTSSATSNDPLSQPGPSSQKLQLFLPPPGPPPDPIYLTSTQDLLGRFQLLPAYHKYVTTFYAKDAQSASSPGIPFPPNSPVRDKGKGKEKEKEPTISPVGDAQEADDDDGAKGEKKKKDTYKSLIKGIPGRHSMKKDDYLTTIMQIPPKDRMRIVEFDQRTQKEAFNVSLEPLKNWNVNNLIAESSEAREDRKRRKEQKKQAKAHAAAALGMSAQQPSPPLPPSAPPQSRPPVAMSTPAAHLPTPSAGSPPPPRGKKRELEPDAGANAGTQKTVVVLKTGVQGARPRPAKRQRVDMQGKVAIPVQQPTPQGA